MVKKRSWLREYGIVSGLSLLITIKGNFVNQLQYKQQLSV